MNNKYYKLWKIHKTIKEMLKDRDYEIDKELLEMDIIEWIEKYGKKEFNIENSILKFSKKDEKINVYFNNEENLKITFIEKIIKDLSNSNTYNGIIVIKNKIDITNDKIGMAIINLINSSKYDIELFDEKELLFNITKHELVPKHEKISEKEKEELLKTYNINIKQLPRILKKDPVIRYYNYKKNDVVKITRKSESSGLYINYRLVE